MKKSIFYFTLVELLTVIAVIAILAGIAVPVIVGISSKGKETSARADMNSIKLALTQFKADYSVWPAGAGADVFYSAAFNSTETGKNDGDIDTLIQNLTLVNISPGTNDVPATFTSALNTKRRKYMEVPAKPVTPLVPNGTVTRGFFKIDPWGRRYNIALDGNYDKQMALPTTFSRAASVENIAGDIAIFSYGDAEAADDVDGFLYSWKTVAD
ncbi:MAG: prepilin-type N-terminal cleavage/methylation domain-containing protein [Lentisphaeria bacterium]|nr:prepilin-type N-terminal cleavage/methylation domain-containing protein [Lentisphaeria bacterium]